MTAQESIRNLRLQLLLNKNEFAKQLNVTRGAISNYESGRRVPQYSVLRKIKELATRNGIKITIDDFIN